MHMYFHVHVYTCTCTTISATTLTSDNTHVLMRDERKKQSNKQTRQSNTAHPHVCSFYPHYTQPTCIYIYHCTTAIHVLHPIFQVILEHLPFMSVPVLECAFRTQRVLVDGSPVEASHSLALGQTWEMVFHRHETEVCVATSQPLPHVIVGAGLHL